MKNFAKKPLGFMQKKNVHQIHNRAGNNPLKIPPLPSLLQIELSNECNMKDMGGYCPLCTPMRTSKRPKGILDSSLYTNLVDELKGKVQWFKSVGHGEPTVHPDVWKLLGYAEQNGIQTHICTNGENLNLDVIDEIVENNITSLQIDLDGITAKAHNAYRKGSDFQKLQKNILTLSDKKKQGVLSTTIAIQSIALKTNEDELDQLTEWCNVLGFNHKITPASFGHWRIPGRETLLKKYLPANPKLRRSSMVTEVKKNRYRILKCPWYQQAMVLSNGDVVKCCCDIDGELVIGNLRDSSFTDIWFSKKHLEIIKKIQEGKATLCATAPCGRTIED